MNENGKHKLRRSDRIRKNIQNKIMEEDPYHFHKKQCKLFDVLERKISLLEERIKVLEQEKPEEAPTEEPEEKPVDELFPWDLVWVVFILWLFSRCLPSSISLGYIYQPAIAQSTETL